MKISIGCTLHHPADMLYGSWSWLMGDEVNCLVWTKIKVEQLVQRWLSRAGTEEVAGISQYWDISIGPAGWTLPSG